MIKDVIVADYAEIIKRSRESKGLKQEELANEINEKTSLIHKLESKRFIPPLLLARKLEKFLDIRLVGDYRKYIKTTVNLKNKDLTIGDLINIKKDDK